MTLKYQTVLDYFICRFMYLIRKPCYFSQIEILHCHLQYRKCFFKMHVDCSFKTAEIVMHTDICHYTYRLIMTLFVLWPNAYPVRSSKQEKNHSSDSKKWPDAHRMMKSHCLFSCNVQIMQRRQYFIKKIKRNLNVTAASGICQGSWSQKRLLLASFCVLDLLFAIIPSSN